MDAQGQLWLVDSDRVPLEPMQEFALEMGPQGGFHLSLSALMVPGDADSRIEVEQRVRLGGTLVSQTRYRPLFVSLDERASFAPLLPVVLCPPSSGSPLGAPVHIELARGHDVTAIELIPHCDGSALCAEVCSP